MREILFIAVLTIAPSLYASELFEGAVVLKESKNGMPIRISNPEGEVVDLSYNKQGALKQIKFKSSGEVLNFPPAATR